VHTLSGDTPVSVENQGGTGESINHDFSEVGRKQSLGREMKRVLDPIEEIDEEYAKECESQTSYPRSNAGDRDSKSIDAFADSRDPKESNYQLRRTVKLINLHHEFNKEDIQVVLGPKRMMDSSSSDSCDEDVIFAKTSNTNKSKDIANNNDSLIHGTN